jgi:hypothetical protein
VVPIVRGQLEARFKQSSRDRAAHIADTDKSEPVFVLRNWFHDESPFRFQLPHSLKARVVPFRQKKRAFVQDIDNT